MCRPGSPGRLEGALVQAPSVHCPSRLGWVNFQVLRRTQASLGHKEGIDPKVAADQRGHVIGVAIDTYTTTDLESRREAETKLESALKKREESGEAVAAASEGE